MFKNSNTESKLITDASDLFLTELAKTEDFESFVGFVHNKLDCWKTQIIQKCIEKFDNQIRSEIPSSWTIVKRLPRSITCVFGKIQYSRTLFIDNFGRNRYLCDELLGIPYKKRFSQDAYKWLLKSVSETTYGKTARNFYSMSGAKVSKMTIWKMVQNQAELIMDFYQTPYGEQISAESICVESDGIFIALQNPKRRKEAISRYIYRQNHHKKSFELKVAATYAGKLKESTARNRRVNVNLYATIGSGEEIMHAINNQIKNEYDINYLKQIFYGSDGGGWCKNHNLYEISNHINVNQSLDGFHIMQAIWRVFPHGKVQDWLVYLILRRKPETAIRNLKRVIMRLHGPIRQKARELLTYLENNVDLIKANFNLGTIEATNAHVWARRMKHIGGAWSKHGGNSMAILLSHLHSGKQIIPQPKNIFFDETDKIKKEKTLQKITNEIQRQRLDLYEPNSGRINCQRVKDLFIPSISRYPK